MVTNRVTRGALGFAGLVAVAVGLLAWRDLVGARPASSSATFGVSTPDTTMLSASLLRRLGAAVDGYRTGEPVYVVAAFDPPHYVAGVFENRDSADVVRERFQREFHRPYGRFGPYVAPKDLGRPIVFLARPRCWPTIYNCVPNISWQPPDPPWLVEDLDSLSITAYHHSRGTWRMKADPKDVDAVFFTMSVIDKFVLPYYAALSGPEIAQRMRDSLEVYIRGAPER